MNNPETFLAKMTADFRARYAALRSIEHLNALPLESLLKRVSAPSLILELTAFEHNVCINHIDYAAVGEIRCYFASALTTSPTLAFCSAAALHADYDGQHDAACYYSVSAPIRLTHAPAEFSVYTLLFRALILPQS